MQEFVGAHYAAVKVNTKDQKDLAKKFGTLWTPQIFATTPEGDVLHFTIGYLPPDDFLAEFTYGLARGAMKQRDFESASRFLARLGEKWPKHDRTPEAQYWLGVSEFRRTGGIDAAKVAWRRLFEGWPQSAWAGRVKWVFS